MHLRQFWLFASLFLFSVSLFSQNTFERGYIITNESDTLKGYIKNKEWAIHPKFIEFKENLRTEATTQFTPKDIQLFNINEQYIYVSKVVEIDSLPRKIQNLTREKKPHFKKEHVFLNLIVGGKVPLYFLKDDNGKTHYFFEKEGQTQELIYIRYLSEDFRMRESKKFIGQMNLYLRDCEKVLPLIQKAEYKAKSLKKIFIQYNNCFGETITSFNKQEKKIKKKFGVMAGLTYTKVWFGGHNASFTEYLNFKSTLSYTFGATFDLIFPRFEERFSLKNELLYKPFQQSAKATRIIDDNLSIDYFGELDLAYLKLNVLGQYKLKPGDNTFFLFFGPSNGFAIKKDNQTKITDTFFATITERDVPTVLHYNIHEMGIVIGGGYQFGNFTVEGRFERGSGMTAEASLRSKTFSYFLTSKYQF